MDPASRLPEGTSKLAKGFAGRLIGPSDVGYEDARRVHNGSIDRRPAMIARCRGVADVADAVAFGRANNLELAIRGGGHNVAGRATVDGGLVIDLSLMKGIWVDPRVRRARAQGGVTWGELNRETQAHGLATTGGVVSSTGIAGLTLGGGLGWLMSKYGLTVDNLESVEMVTADGRILKASAEENEDLFWAVRGGGGNFGVATSFDYRLHAVGPTITGGFVAHPFERAYEVLRFYRDLTDGLPDEMTAYAGLIHGPDGSKVAVIALCHCGDRAAGEKAVAPAKAFGAPLIDTVGPMSYCDLNMLFDAAYPRGAHNYWKSSFLSALSDDAIRTAVEGYARVPSPMSQIFLEHLHGKAASARGDGTAFPHRRPGFNMGVFSQWAEASQTEGGMAWARETHAAMNRFCSSARYGNYQSEEGAEVAAAVYGPNYARLQQVKRRYDPENLFHLNQNIAPAEKDVLSASG
jgi:FAD/FMN-containing dehydrogenase